MEEGQPKLYGLKIHSCNISRLKGFCNPRASECHFFIAFKKNKVVAAGILVLDWLWWETGSILWNFVDYSYGFNGQEKDDEVAGAGNTNTATFWEYDARLGRRWNIDPVPDKSLSGYACFANSPIWLSDLNGDIVTYSNFKSRVATFFARIANRDYNEKFKKFKADDKNTFNFDYDGKSWSKENKEKYGTGSESVAGFVTSEGEHSFGIHWIKNPDVSSGASKYSSLYEESYHVDDAMGGKIFGGTNKEHFKFENGVLIQHGSTLNPSYGEVDAWIWRADHDKIVTGKSIIKREDGETVTFKIRVNLMQQIHQTSNMNSDARRKLVHQMLYGSYTVIFEEGVGDKGHKFTTNGGNPTIVDGPYRK